MISIRKPLLAIHYSSRVARIRILVLSVLLVATVAEAATTGPNWTGAISLEEAIAFALAHNPRLQSADAQWQAAQAASHEASGAFSPKVAAGVYANAGSVPMIVAGAADPVFLSSLPENRVSLNLSLMLPLYTGGRLQARLAQARAEEKAELARTALALREVARDVRLAFGESRRATALVETGRQEVVEQEELLRVTRDKIKEGSLAAYLERRVEADLAAARQELNRARAEEKSARADLIVALGCAFDSEPEPVASEPSITLDSLLADDVEIALRERPDLAAARALVEADDARLREALAEYSPQLSFYAMGETIQPRADGGYQVGLALSWPLFDGERSPRRERAEALLTARQRELSRLEQVVAGEVLRGRAQLEAALLNRQLAESELVAASEELRVTRLRLDLGRGLPLEVLNAVAIQARARANIASAERDQVVAEANYLYSLGVFQ